MKVVILAGGFGTRLAEETDVIPKPMVEIGGRPLLWHIMKHYAKFGHTDFIIALGYKGEAIKRYFLDYHLLNSNLTVDLADGSVQLHPVEQSNWRVHLVDTGLRTQTGGRLRQLEPWLGRGTFMLTYGDGVSDIDINQLTDFHRSYGCLATITAVRPPARFGGVRVDDYRVSAFTEKRQAEEGWINGGFMVLETGIFKYLEGDDTSLEADVLESLARDRQLVAYRHELYWQCMDTVRDVRVLQEIWDGGIAPWK